MRETFTSIGKLKVNGGLDKIESGIASKLAYEWRNIYRCLTKIDINETGVIDLYDLDRSCL